ncbi:uncharacterized protein VTP21DRAFT_1539 [Calcarisporiella thermophila]|uniref:uncharacterized protein n=1 Tax=Calcarisporiella thermophila TaxID=911321 RepID=UPI00374257AC
MKRRGIDINLSPLKDIEKPQQPENNKPFEPKQDPLANPQKPNNAFEPAAPTATNPNQLPAQNKASSTSKPPPASSSATTQAISRHVVTSGTITSYVTVVPSPDPLLSATIAPTVQQQPKEDTSGNQLVTAGIALGCVIGAAAIGIWVFRKWKLSPSRNFKEKINTGMQYRERTQETDTAFLRELQQP